MGYKSVVYIQPTKFLPDMVCYYKDIRDAILSHMCKLPGDYNKVE